MKSQPAMLSRRLVTGNRDLTLATSPPPLSAAVLAIQSSASQPFPVPALLDGHGGSCS